MAITNHERIGKALDLLKEGLCPFVEREMKAQHAQLWFEQAKESVSDSQATLFGTEAVPRWDVATLLSVMWNQPVPALPVPGSDVRFELTGNATVCGLVWDATRREVCALG